jgi:hypothetical protein
LRRFQAGYNLLGWSLQWWVRFQDWAPAPGDVHEGENQMSGQSLTRTAITHNSCGKLNSKKLDIFQLLLFVRYPCNLKLKSKDDQSWDNFLQKWIDYISFWLVHSLYLGIWIVYKNWIWCDLYSTLVRNLSASPELCEIFCDRQPINLWKKLSQLLSLFDFNLRLSVFRSGITLTSRKHNLRKWLYKQLKSYLHNLAWFIQVNYSKSWPIELTNVIRTMVSGI